jgi:hypothetical protein
MLARGLLRVSRLQSAASRMSNSSLQGRRFADKKAESKDDQGSKKAEKEEFVGYGYSSSKTKIMSFVKTKTKCMRQNQDLAFSLYLRGFSGQLPLGLPTMHICTDGTMKMPYTANVRSA